MADLKKAMPKVAGIVSSMRAQLGKQWVDQCINKAIAGEPDMFYAMERGHIVGTPFSLDVALAEQMRVCFMVGGAGAVIRQPEGVSNGKN
jgi:hypothetical protein